MLVTFKANFDAKRVKGYQVEIDKILYDPNYGDNYKVRVVGEWKRPRWLSIVWFTRL